MTAPTIKPDTSLYTELADRIAAYAEAARTRYDRRFENRLQGSDTWTLCITADWCNLRDLLHGDDYRLAPEPRVRWVLTDQRGTEYGFYYSESRAKDSAANLDKAYPGLAPHTIARFVEVV